jgi:hypothetical protein
MRFLCLLLCLSFSSSLFAAENYTAFNPTPEAKLRALNTERPTKAEYVTTVDPGHFQVESSVINVVKDKNCSADGCDKSNKNSFGSNTLLRFGVTQNSEISVLSSDLYARTKFKSSDGDIEKGDGFGNNLLRFKYSFKGNNNGKYGLAITPFVKISNGQNGVGNRNLRGGVMVPFSMNLNSKWAIGGMTQLEFLRSDNGLNIAKRHDYCAYTNSFYLLRNQSEKLQMFVEYYTYKVDFANSKRVDTIGAGTSYLLTKKLKIDLGVNFGATSAASDLEYYTGFGYKF